MVPRRAVIPGLLILILSLTASAAASPDEDEKLAVVPGEPCLVCDGAVGEGGQAHTYRGRRVALCRDVCISKWRQNPGWYFAAKQPRGALFQESVEAAEAVPASVFWFGVWMLTALLSGAACAYVAVNRERPAVRWFAVGAVGNLLALVLTPLLLKSATPSYLTRPAGTPEGLRKVPTTHTPRPCPDCKREVHPSARKCSGCGTELEPLVESELADA